MDDRTATLVLLRRDLLDWWLTLDPERPLRALVEDRDEEDEDLVESVAAVNNLAERLREELSILDDQLSRLLGHPTAAAFEEMVEAAEDVGSPIVDQSPGE